MSVTKRVKRTVEVEETPQAPSGGESGSEWLERDDHPLLNVLILETLFGFVRRFDLKACRGVCKNWNIESIPHMRATFIVTIGENQWIKSNHRVDDFVELFQKNELGIPFEKFNLGSLPTTDGVTQQFLQLVGEIASEINLYGDIYTVEDVSELLKSCAHLKKFGTPPDVISRSGKIVKLFPDSAPTFSYLKKIVFRLYNKGLRFCPTFIEELLSAAPNIADIGSGSYEYQENDVASGISVVLNTIEKLGKQSSVQSLDLHYAGIEDVEHLERMAKNGLKLKSLSFEAEEGNGDDMDRVQIQLAKMFKDTLQHLKVEQMPADNVLMEYPEMLNLKSLCLRELLNSDPKPVNLNKNFPALETLEIGFEVNWTEWDEFFSQFSSCPTLKSLNTDRCEMTIHIFSNIQRAFPNLTKLDFRVDFDAVEILRLVWSWTQMTQLESLTIRGTLIETGELNLDSLFTGFSPRRLKGIHHIVNRLDKMTVKERRNTIMMLRNEHCRFPAIGNLTKLKHLYLNVNGNGGPDQEGQSSGTVAIDSMTPRDSLSDVTAYLAFHSMIRLNHLEIRDCTFTDTCCEILTKETRLETWMFRSIYPERDIIPPFMNEKKSTIIYN